MATGLEGEWHAGIGDPTFVGWAAVGAYFLTVALAVRAATATRRNELITISDTRRLVAFWRISAVALLLLGVNKQLDLQSWFTQLLRDLSRQQGWYEARRQFQLAFILSLGGIGLLMTLAAAVRLRQVLHRVGVALLGLGVLGTFVVARAASFHHMDALLHSGPLPLNWVAELGGIMLIALNAWFVSRPRM